MDEKIIEIILGMAKGRVRFETNSGSSGAGKRTNSELDILRLVYAVDTLQRSGSRVHAYFAVLRDSNGRTTKHTVEQWLLKYNAASAVRVIERILTAEETNLLEAEKTANASAQERRGGNASAAVAKRLAEIFLDEYIKAAHPSAKRGEPSDAPFGVAWDAFYLAEAGPIAAAVSN
jgi:hypothetical protein